MPASIRVSEYDYIVLKQDRKRKNPNFNKTKFFGSEFFNRGNSESHVYVFTGVR